MTPNEYQDLAMRTAPEPGSGEPIELGIDVDGRAVVHGAIGLATEVGELQDAIKRAMFYGRPLDAGNVVEECGDVLWYLALVLQSAGYTLEEAMAKNIAKLRARYPEKFTADAALNRDLAREAQAMGSAR